MGNGEAMSKIQRLNFGTEFRDFVRSNPMRPEFSRIQERYEEVADGVAQAQTFLLRDGGAYTPGKNVPANIAVGLRLPFPITSFEYRRADGTGKRILLAAEQMLEGDELGIVALDIYGTSAGWALNPTIAVWKIGATHTITANDVVKCEIDAQAAKRVKSSTKTYTPKLGEEVLDFRTIRAFDTPMHNSPDDQIFDAGGAIDAILNVTFACAILRCRNVKVIDVPLTPGDRYINDRRHRKGLTPFVEYKVLQLGEKKIYTNDLGGTHESPKWHMVMGFVRRLTDDKYYTADTPMEARTRTTFVAAHARGNADKGKIVKDYQLEVPNG